MTDITNQAVCVGTKVTWSVVATGNDLTYQWQRDGTNLLEGVGHFFGTTSSTLTNSVVALNDSLPAARGYVCMVSGACATMANSSRVSLEVSPPSANGFLVREMGNTYSGSSPMGLAAVLDRAAEGERILVVSYGSGSGSDGFVFRATAAIARCRDRAPSLRSQLDGHRVHLTYAQYAKYRGKYHLNG